MSDKPRDTDAFQHQYRRPLSELGPPPSRNVGRTVRGGYGYLLEYCPDHPHCTKLGYVRQHRLVAEAVLGRFLLPEEVVHHEDEVTSNNNPSNLWLFPSQAEHNRHHKRTCPIHDRALVEKLRSLAADPRVTVRDAAAELGVSTNTVNNAIRLHGIRWEHGLELTETSVREALAGRTTREAAELLGVNHQTLRNSFDHLLSKRVSPGSLERHRDEIRSLASTLHARELAPRYGVSPATLKAAIRRWKTAEPDAWSDVSAFQSDRRLSGGGRPKRSSAARQCPT